MIFVGSVKSKFTFCSVVAPLGATGDSSPCAGWPVSSKRSCTWKLPWVSCFFLCLDYAVIVDMGCIPNTC